MTVQSRLQTRKCRRAVLLYVPSRLGGHLTSYPSIHPTPALPPSFPPLSCYLPACPHLSQLPHLTLHHPLSKHLTSVSLLSTCLYIVSHIGKRFSICPCPHLRLHLPSTHHSPITCCSPLRAQPTLALYSPDLFPSVSTLLSVSWVRFVLCLIKPRT